MKVATWRKLPSLPPLILISLLIKITIKTKRSTQPTMKKNQHLPTIAIVSILASLSICLFLFYSRQRQEGSGNQGNVHQSEEPVIYSQSSLLPPYESDQVQTWESVGKTFKILGQLCNSK